MQTLLITAAAAQLALAGLNLFIVRLLKWRADLERMPLLMREVFWVHTWFISVTLTIFAVMTLRFIFEIVDGSNVACTSLAAAIGIFWGIRTVIQLSYYSPTHWRGRPGKTVIHIGLCVLYSGMSAVYLAAAGRTYPP